MPYWQQMSHPLWWITTPELYSHSSVGVVGLWALPTREDSPRKSSPSLGDLRLRKSRCLSCPRLPSPSGTAPAVPSFARRWRSFSAASLMSASILAGVIFYFLAVSEEVQRVKKNDSANSRRGSSRDGGSLSSRISHRQ